MAFDGEILALDVASRTGVAEGRPGETPRLYSVDFSKSDDDHESVYGRATVWMARRLRVSRPDLVVIEAPIPASAMRGKTNANTTALLFGLWAVVSGIANAKGIRVMRANIQTVRKSFIGRGNLSGSEAKKQTVKTCKLLGWNAPNHDAADAGAVWTWACHQVARDLAPRTDPISLQLLAKQREVF